MSFASDTKNELARIEPEKKCCMLSEIAAYIRTAGSIGIVGFGKLRITITTDNAAVARHYKKLIKTTMFMSFVGMLSLSACAKPLIYVLIGEQWGQAAVYLPILCFIFMMYPVRAINTNMLQVKGRTDKLLILEVIKKMIAIGPLFLGIFVSIYWMLWGSFVTNTIGYILNSYFSGKYIKYTTWQQFMDILPSFIFGCVVAGVIYCCTLLGFTSVTTLTMQILIGAVLVFVIGEATKFEPYLDLKGIFISTYSKIRKIIN